jgi:hypothetical protein
MTITILPEEIFFTLLQQFLVLLEQQALHGR